MPDPLSYDAAMRKAITYAHRSGADFAIEPGEQTALVIAQLARYAQASVAWTAIAAEIRQRAASVPTPTTPPREIREHAQSHR